jgi:hypothetical protein
MIVSEIDTILDKSSLKRVRKPSMVDRAVERMTPRMSSRQEQDKQMLMIRLLLVVVLPIVLILASAEYITTKNVNPLLTVVGTGVMTMLATMLRVNGNDDKPKQ